tara:strand:+ start:381 stop:932 length:552 start_codon:yes stop_codon:yes gene_type:complete
MRIFIYFFLIIIYACDENNSIRTYSIPKQNNTLKTIEDKLEKNNLFFSWSSPSHWMEGNVSPMRLASYIVPFSHGEADLSITNFSGDGGGLLANVNRWRGQLKLSSQTLEQISKKMYIGESGLGQFKLLKIFNNDDHSTAFLCGVFEIEESTIFAKLSAPLLGVNEIEEEFKKFCSSFKYNDK